MPFQYTFRADDITTWEAETRDLIENRDRELELYSTTIDNSFLNLNASNLTSGTVPSARMTGAYTGITSVGTLGSLTVTGDLTVDTNTLRVDSTNNRVGINVTSPTANLDIIGNQVIRAAATQDGIQLAGRAGGTTSLTTKLIPTTLTANRTLTLPNVDGTAITTGNLSDITAVGTLASGSIPATLLSGTVASARLSGAYTGITQLGTISPSLTVTGGTGTTITAIANALITGSDNSSAIYLGGNTGSNATGGIEASWRGASNPSIAFGVTRDNNGTKIVCEYTGGVIKFFGGGTQEAYLNNGGFSANHYYGAVQYGFFGSLSVYGVNNTWAGIVFPDTSSTVMVQNTIFGHYRNNTTWNFYVQNGAYVPSDARYKRNIQPLQNGMNLIRHITPVTYDPLTENPDDDPETTVGRIHYGFTTQNVIEALELSGETRDVAVVDVGGPDTTTGGDRQYLNHSALIAPMVKAIQELDARLQQLENP